MTQRTADHRVAWLCRWDGGQLLTWAESIEQARLNARYYAGPDVAVSARLATDLEKTETEPWRAR